MTNKEYIDFLIVCNKLDTRGLERYIDVINKSDVDIKQLIKLGLNMGNKVDSLFFSLKTLIKGFEHRKDLVDLVISRIFKIYYSYIKYRIEYHHSKWFFFNMMIYDIGIALADKDCNILYELNEHRVIDVEDRIRFYINDKRYDVKVLENKGFLFYEQDKLLKENTHAICLKDNTYEMIDNVKDLKSMEEGGYEIVLVCVDELLHYCDDITYKLLGNKYKNE